MNEAHVKAVIVDEVEKYSRTQYPYPDVHGDFPVKMSFTSEIIHYTNTFGEIEAYVLTTITSDTYQILSRKLLVKVIISDGKLFIQEILWPAVSSQFIYLEKGVL